MCQMWDLTGKFGICRASFGVWNFLGFPKLGILVRKKRHLSALGARALSKSITSDVVKGLRQSIRKIVVFSISSHPFCPGPLHLKFFEFQDQENTTGNSGL
jgi:hypothetical protein